MRCLIDTAYANKRSSVVVSQPDHDVYSWGQMHGYKRLDTGHEGRNEGNGRGSTFQVEAQLSIFCRVSSSAAS